MKEHYSGIITHVGEDPDRQGLLDTPKRAAKAMQFLTQGYEQDLDEIINGAVFDSDNDEMVLVKNIEVYSLCEHHLLPIIGHAHVAYIPNGRVLGLSKLARVVDMFARRFQIQENLTKQIGDAIDQVINPRGVAVQITAAHMCMMMRGVQKQQSVTTTSVMTGEFKTNKEARIEFLHQVNGDRPSLFS
ncbi:MAG: GTP cyclohydrolase I FolE [Gammaproteobacteria bacterium]